MIMTTTPIAPAEAATDQDHEDPNLPASDRGPHLSNRRQALVAVGLGAGALTLAACGSSSTPTAAPAPSSAAAAASPSAAAPSSAAAAPSAAAPASTGAASSAAAPPAASSPAAATSSAAAAGGAASSANTLVVLSKVPVGGAVAASDANGKPIIIAQPTAGKAVAFSAICTHMGCTVAVNGAELDCPCHGSKFNALTGAVLNGPAPSPLPTVTVEVKSGNVVAG